MKAKEIQKKIDSILESLTEPDGGNAVTESDVKDAKIELIEFKKYVFENGSTINLESDKRCDCGQTENVKNIPICASCYNPHTGKW